MSFKKVDLSNEGQLMTAIQQNEIEEILVIWKDKHINKELVELTQSLGLTSNQKKKFFEVINNLTLNSPKAQGKPIPTKTGSECNETVEKGIPIGPINAENTQNTCKKFNSNYENPQSMNITEKNLDFLRKLNSVLEQKCPQKPLTSTTVEDIPVTPKLSPAVPRKLAKSLDDLVYEMYQADCTPPPLPARQSDIKNMKEHGDENKSRLLSFVFGGCLYKNTEISQPLLSQADNDGTSSGSSLQQSPLNANKVSPMANREPMPLPIEPMYHRIRETLPPGKHGVDNQQYSKYHQNPVDTNLISNHHRTNGIEVKKSREQHDFHVEISAAVKEKFVYEKTMEVQKNSIHTNTLSTTFKHTQHHSAVKMSRFSESKKSGNANIAGILLDKNLDGQELLDLTELKIRNWKLTSSQRKKLFSFIDNLKVNPSNPLGKCIVTNVSKSDTDVTKSIPTKSMFHEITQNVYSNSLNSASGNPLEMVISEKKANFVQELNSLLSGGHCTPSAIPKNIETDNNQARPLAKTQVEDLPVASSNQTTNIPRFISDNGTITSKYDQESSFPLWSAGNCRFLPNDSMNLSLPIAQPVQNILKTSPKPRRKTAHPRPGQAKSMEDLVIGWDQPVSVPPVPVKQRVGKKMSDHKDKIIKGPGVIEEYSVCKMKETRNASPMISRQITGAELSSGTSLLQSPQSIPNVSPVANRKPVPLPSRGLDQAVCDPLPICKQKSSTEKYAIEKYRKKQTRKVSLPIISQVTHAKASSGLSLSLSPPNGSSLSPGVIRKPLPLPTRRLIQPPAEYSYQAVSAPSNKQQFTKQANENKYSIEQDANGKNLDSDELRKKEEPSTSKFVDLKEEAESPTRSSTFYIPLEKSPSQGTANRIHQDIDDHVYLEILESPADKNPVQTDPKKNDIEKKSEKRNEFHVELSNAVKEEVVRKEVAQWIVQDHSHLSLIITPPSSSDEMFDEDQDEGYTNEQIPVNGSTTNDKVVSKPLLRPPTRMVTANFTNKNGYVTIFEQQDDATRFDIDNLANDHYYMQIRGKETKRLLMPREDGTFLFRPGRKFFLVLTIKHASKLYNLGIDLADDGKIYLNAESGSALAGFSSLSEFVHYFCCEPIAFEDDGKMVEIYMNPFLGPDSFSLL